MQQLAFRYATEDMRNVWSEARRVSSWRQVWAALASAQAECGLVVTAEQAAQLRAKVDTFATDPAERHRLGVLEAETRHDVMAHVRLLGEVCPAAGGVVHLGATSCDITDNADLLLIREGLDLVRHRLVGAIDRIAALAAARADQPCLAYTHYQPASLTTVGKRFTLWAADLAADLQDVERARRLRFRGLKGASGTQASYLRLCGGDDGLVLRLERLVAQRLGFDDVAIATGQTYSRRWDSRVAAALAGIGQTAHKIGTDLRLLQHDGEVLEGASPTQVGSSAMPHKRNPARAERLCSLSRYLVNEAHNAEATAMNQWLERTLDDSAVRRISLPNVFLAADAVLHLLLAIVGGLEVRDKVIAARVGQELPFLLCEPILAEAGRRGRDRREVHEHLRAAAREAAEAVAVGAANPLLAILREDHFYRDIVDTLDMDPESHTGRAAAQVREFLAAEVEPIAARYPDSLGQTAEINV